MIDAVDIDGKTSLHKTLQNIEDYKSTRILKILLIRGADRNIKVIIIQSYNNICRTKMDCQQETMQRM
jgi:hypothetical protein